MGTALASAVTAFDASITELISFLRRARTHTAKDDADFHDLFPPLWECAIACRKKVERLAIGDPLHSQLVLWAVEPFAWFFPVQNATGKTYDLFNFDYLREKGELAARFCPIQFDELSGFRRQSIALLAQIESRELSVTLRQCRKMFSLVGKQQDYPGKRNLEVWAQSEDFPPAVNPEAKRYRRYLLTNLEAYLKAKGFERV